MKTYQTINDLPCMQAMDGLLADMRAMVVQWGGKLETEVPRAGADEELDETAEWKEF